MMHVRELAIHPAASFTQPNERASTAQKTEVGHLRSSLVGPHVSYRAKLDIDHHACSWYAVVNIYTYAIKRTSPKTCFEMSWSPSIHAVQIRWE